MHAWNSKPFVTLLKGRRDTTLSRLKKFKIVLPNYQRDIWVTSQFWLLSNQKIVISPLTQPEHIKVCWCEYYTELLNHHPIVGGSVLHLIEQQEPIVSLEEVPSWDEINISVKQMNNNKALGMNSITAEILKWGGDEMINHLVPVIYNVLESEAPQYWRDVIWGQNQTANFRSISLLSNVGKVFLRILLNRLISVIVNKMLPESQCGFRADCRTVDMIFSAWQPQEICREQNLSFYHCFIDLSKSFDITNRSTIWKILLKLCCPEKLVGLIWSLHDGMKARVAFCEALPNELPVDTGVKQGDISAPMLFTIYFTVVFLVAFSKNLDGVSTSDIECLVKYTISIDCWNTQRSPLCCFMQKIVTLSHILKMKWNVLWTILV